MGDACGGEKNERKGRLVKLVCDQNAGPEVPLSRKRERSKEMSGEELLPE